MRAHKGVDYAAATGTRVKASGDGIVTFVGTKGGYGNVVVLQHANKISTVYGHLSRFAPGIRQGAKVSQGEIIAFVGMRRDCVRLVWYAAYQAQSRLVHHVGGHHHFGSGKQIPQLAKYSGDGLPQQC
jgi:septal ring factor EnvC (AmiA/AmiB activator)